MPPGVNTRLEQVRERVCEAARAAGRDPQEVTIVGVTKSVGVAEARTLLDAGLRDLGENRPEELARKAGDPALQGARWHLIGTYQRRRVRDTLAVIDVIHSVHTTALAGTIASRAAVLGRRVDCLVQVNVSGEKTKQGFSPGDIRAAWDALRALSAIRWRGLMTMAPINAPPDVCRRVFAATRALRDELADGSCPLPDLSMGMSQDFDQAVLEGATLVRVGTALFHSPPGA